MAESGWYGGGKCQYRSPQPSSIKQPLKPFFPPIGCLHRLIYSHCAVVRMLPSCVVRRYGLAYLSSIHDAHFSLGLRAEGHPDRE